MGMSVYMSAMYCLEMSLWLRSVIVVVCVQAWKKIEETKKKATEIMIVRQRNNENKAFKDQLKQ